MWRVLVLVVASALVLGCATHPSQPRTDSGQSLEHLHGPPVQDGMSQGPESSEAGPNEHTGSMATPRREEPEQYRPAVDQSELRDQDGAGLQRPPELTSDHRFSFKFEAGRSLAYSIDTKMSVAVDGEAGAEKINTKYILDFRSCLTLVPVTESGSGISTIRLQPSRIEGDWDLSEPDGRLVVSLRGEDMKGTRNGAVVIDTVRGIGVSAAQEFKKDILPLYLSGEVDIDTRGNAKQFRGDVTFVEFWREAGGGSDGFFCIVFPDREITVGESWDETFTLQKLGQVTLEGKGLDGIVAFTRQPDVVVQDERLSAFTFSAPFNFKDVTGLTEEMGQIVRVNFSEFERHASGSFRFDQERGILTESAMNITGNGLMNVLLQGQAVTLDLQIGVEMRMNLLPNTAEAMRPEVVPVRPSDAPRS